MPERIAICGECACALFDHDDFGQCACCDCGWTTNEEGEIIDICEDEDEE